jgi:prepilin-type N-terminal cleavage/methylation domain-containing protein
MKSSSKADRLRISFTLIELLVVVAIIAVLVSVLLPAMAAARNRARESVCLSNLRQIGVAFINYSVPNNDYVVPSANDWSGQLAPGVRPSWQGLSGWWMAGPLWYDRLAMEGVWVLEYENTRALRCPAHVPTGIYAQPYERWVSYASSRYTSGAVSNAPGSLWGLRTFGSFRRSPSGVVLVGERGNLSEPAGFPWSVAGTNIYWWSGYNANGSGMNWLRHAQNAKVTTTSTSGGRSAILLADGHAVMYESSFPHYIMGSGGLEGIWYNPPDPSCPSLVPN